MSDVVRRSQAGDCRPWEAPPVGSRDATPRPAATDPAAVRRQASHDGYAEGLARGREEGRRAAVAELEQQRRQLAAIVAALADPLAAADERIVAAIGDLAIAIARRLIRRELRTRRDEIVGVVREALAVLPPGLGEVRLHLHPDDARLVAEALTPAEGDAAWRIIEDPVITRGGCRISSPTSQVDATLEARLDRVINAMLGGERDADDR